MTDKDKMIGEMAKELFNYDHERLGWRWKDYIKSQPSYISKATHLFNAGIRPAGGFDVDISGIKTRNCKIDFDRDVSVEYTIKPKSYGGNYDTF